MSGTRSSYVFLNDRETFSSLEGCVIVVIDDDNLAARDALDGEDFDELFDLADVILPIVEPTPFDHS
jgi:hypothetical protein